MKQTIMILSTEGNSLRCLVTGLTLESGETAHSKMILSGKDVAVGLIGGYYTEESPKTPLHAMGTGWRLMSPPIANDTGFEWWFEKT